MKEKVIRCCICQQEIKGIGHNPQGAAWKNEAGQIIRPIYDRGARCCDACNYHFVIPGRLYGLSQAIQNVEQKGYK